MKYLSPFIIILMMIARLSVAQTFIAITQGSTMGKGFTMGMAQCDTTPLLICPPTNNPGELFEMRYGDVALHNNDIYFVSNWGSLYKSAVGASSCQFLGTFSYAINSLVTDSSGVIYAAGHQNGMCKLFKYNAGNFSVVGNFPSGYFSSGDLFFYNGRLFMTCMTASLSDPFMIEVNISDPSKSCYYMSLQNHMAWGAFSLLTGAGSQAYIVSVYPTGASELREVNMSLKTVGTVICTYPYLMAGCATDYKKTNGMPGCNAVSIDFNGSNAEENLLKLVNPVDDRLKFKSDQPGLKIDYLLIKDVNGRELKSFYSIDVKSEPDVSDLPAGIYYLYISVDGYHRAPKKLIKIR